MKTTMTAVLGLVMIAASAFAAQDAPKTATTPKTDAPATTKVKKHKKATKSTDAAKPAVTPAPASK